MTEYQLSETTIRLLQHYNKKFDEFQKTENTFCEENTGNINININKKYFSSILNATYQPSLGVDESLVTSVKKLDEEKSNEETPFTFKCNTAENNKNIASTNKKTQFDFIEDQDFMFKVIKYRRLEVMKQLLYFKKNIELYKYFCVIVSNLQSKFEKEERQEIQAQIQEKINILSNLKQQTLHILQTYFLNDSENLLKKTLFKYKFIMDRFYNLIPKKKIEDQKWYIELKNREVNFKL
uniref:Uncharacterized protein n=1 Tax=viral metagenome TaxID=1070528 RepID=A0A6C0B0T6_9ZZZZ